MKKNIMLFALLLSASAVSAYAEDNNTDVKKWSFNTGISHTERQQGRITSRVYDQGYPGADDLIEDGDVSSIFTSLGYQINDKWAVDYKYAYDYIDHNENFGRDADKDSGQYITHTARLIRSYDPFTFAGKDWDSSVWIGGRSARESSIEGQDANGNQEYKYRGYSSYRFLANANMNTDLSEKTHLDLNYNYQFRDYSYDDGGASANQHRHYITATVDHDFNDAWYVSLENTLYLRQEVGNSRNYGEWDYAYTLGHKYPLANGYFLNTEFTAWGELGLWEKGARQVDDHNQAELVFMPKIKKNFVLADDMNISAFVGAGYVYGYDTRTNRKQYAGFEGRFGAVYSYKF